MQSLFTLILCLRHRVCNPSAVDDALDHISLAEGKPDVQEDAFKPFDFNTLLKHDIENHAEKVSGIALKASKEAGEYLSFPGFSQEHAITMFKS